MVYSSKRNLMLLDTPTEICSMRHHKKHQKQLSNPKKEGCVLIINESAMILRNKRKKCM